MKTTDKRLIFELDRGLHTSMKIVAAQKRMTLKSFVTLAIVKALQEENNAQIERMNAEKRLFKKKIEEQKIQEMENEDEVYFGDIDNTL
jgi:capsule polysaccharide export protein KpsE/RkpR